MTLREDANTNHAFRCSCVLFAAAVALLPPGLTAQSPDDLPIVSSGLHATILRREGRPSIYYAISIPPNYTPTVAVPLVLALHYGVGGSTGSGAGRDLVRIVVGPAFADLGAIIVAPDSLGGDWSTPENEDAVDDLLEAIVARYAVDTKKIAVTGYSMGGAGTWHIAEKFRRRFSAAIPVSGRPPASAPGWTLPVFAVHSRNDQVMPFGPTEARVTELQKAGVNAKLVALTGITHFEMNRFVPALRQAVPWLREVWLRESPK